VEPRACVPMKGGVGLGVGVGRQWEVQEKKLYEKESRTLKDRKLRRQENETGKIKTGPERR